MKLEKPSPSLVVEFKAVQAQLRGALPRKMFGYDAAFVNGNMAVGLWQNTCVVKVSAADSAELLARGSAVPFAPNPGRVMTGWLELSEEVAHDPEELLKWSQRAVDYVMTLPPKPAREQRVGATRRPVSAAKPVSATKKKKARIKRPS